MARPIQFFRFNLSLLVRLAALFTFGLFLFISGLAFAADDLRKEFPNFQYPNFDYSYNSFINELKNSDRNKNTEQLYLKYCEMYKSRYVKKSEKLLQIDNLSKMFERSCSDIKLFATSPALSNGEKTGQVEKIVKILMDKTLITLHQNPVFVKVQRLSKIEEAYNSSIFGMINLDMKYSFILTQFLCLSAFILGVAGVIRK